MLIAMGKENLQLFLISLGGPYGDWSYVQPQISKITRTFSYDRAGIVSSDTE